MISVTLEKSFDTLSTQVSRDRWGLSWVISHLNSAQSNGYSGPRSWAHQKRGKGQICLFSFCRDVVGLLQKPHSTSLPNGKADVESSKPLSSGYLWCAGGQRSSLHPAGSQERKMDRVKWKSPAVWRYSFPFLLFVFAFRTHVSHEVQSWRVAKDGLKSTVLWPEAPFQGLERFWGSDNLCFDTLPSGIYEAWLMSF